MPRQRFPMTVPLAALLVVWASGAWLPGQEDLPLTVARVIEMLQQGTSPEALIAMVEKGGDFDLTLDDAVRLRKLGAPPELVRMLARGGPPAELVLRPHLEPAAEPLEEALTVTRVMRLYRLAIPPGDIAALIAQKGLKEPPEVQELLDLRSQGVPAVIVRALAVGGAARAAASPPPALPPAPPEKPEPPLAVADVIRMLELKQDPASIAAAIARRRMKGAPTLEEAITLRRAGATDEVLVAINAATPPPPPPPPVEAAAQPPEAPEATPAEVPSPGEDVVWITSVPPGARVYVSPASTRLREAFDPDYLSGQTPLRLSLPPGDYTVIVQKEADAFDDGLIPAWRTLHDTVSTRTVLDNADLTFDPASCCLPSSLSGTADARPVPEGIRGGILGDQFDGLPPYLFDGESFQIMSVRKSRITHVMKVYDLRKNAGQARLLASTFVPAEGDPLDEAVLRGLPAGRPFDPYLDAEGMDYLASSKGLASLAEALGVETAHLSEAISMLRRAGKAILHQQVEGGVRLIALSVQDYGRLRVSDRTVRPVDPFAPPPDPRAKKRKKNAPPPPPPLPQLAREVVPGLGLPHLLVENTTPDGVGLLFADGQFCFAPPRESRECVVDPGTFEVRVGGGGRPGPAPQGTLHFSYHARYTLSF